MKTKGIKKLITLVVGVLYVLTAFVTSGIFYVASAETPVSLNNAIYAYDSTKGYSFIYFGEYPQTRVREVTNGTGTGKTGWDTFPNYSEESLNVEETIKGYIRDLNEQYYKEYLPSREDSEIYNAVQEHFNVVGTLSFDNYKWDDCSVLTFYPQENFETKYLYFDYATGYYTLKTNVVCNAENGVNTAGEQIVSNFTKGEIAYTAGTKIHTYNWTVDSYNKNAGYTTAADSTVKYGTNYAPTTLIKNGAGITKYNDNLNEYPIVLSDGTKKSWNSTNDNKKEVYLYVVEPIKWRVLSKDSNKIEVISESILDSSVFNFGHGNEWAYSNFRGWLNSEQQNVYTSGVVRTYLPSNYSFYNRAFSSSIKSAIVNTTITQLSSKSYYNDVWHYYVETEGQTLETAPSTTDKVYLLSVAQGEADTKLKHGPCTDYSVATGTFDWVLHTAYEKNLVSYQQSLVSGLDWPYRVGGYWTYRDAGDSSYQIVSAHHYNNIRSSVSPYITNGVRPVLTLDLSKLSAVASIYNIGISGWRNIGVEPNDQITNEADKFGTQEKPVLLDYASQSEYATANSKYTNTSVAYSVATNGSYASVEGELLEDSDLASIGAKMGGTWSVHSIEKITEGANANKYKHVIAVNYKDQLAGSYLVAKVYSLSSKTNIAMAPITDTLINHSKLEASSSAYFVSGVTYFEFITSSANTNYLINIYACNGTSLTSANIYALIDGNADINSILQGYTKEDGITQYYEYVYFGEYPQSSVLEVTNITASNGDGYGNFTFSSDSVNAENTIKGYIEQLTEQYYNNYLPNHTTSANYSSLSSAFGSYPYTTSSPYNWQGNNCYVLTYYPLENFETTKLFFDYKTGYYTLKVDVTSGSISYPKGTKIHAYNNVVDSWNKFSGYTIGSNYHPHGSYSNITNVNITNETLGRVNYWESSFWADLNGDGTKETSYNMAKPGNTYLYVVEPIKWRIIGREGSTLTVISENILDASSFYIKENYLYESNNEWSYSNIRSWLNGIEIYSGNSDGKVLTTYGRSFIDMAFNQNTLSAIVDTKITQNSSKSFYNNTWHDYGSGEIRPTTTNKVWLLNTDQAWSDLLGTSLGGVDDARHLNYVAYNTDYAIANGNLDYKLGLLNNSSTSFEQNFFDYGIKDKYTINNYWDNKEEWHGASWWLLTAYTSENSVMYVGDGGWTSNTGVGYSYGVRPCVTLDLSALFISNVSSENASSVTSTSSTPINANTQTFANAGVSHAYSAFAKPSSNIGVDTAIGSWKQVGSVTGDATNGYTHSIEVNYSGVLAGSLLTALVSDKYGETLGFATIASGVNASNGVAYFTFTGSFANISDYVIQFFSTNNSELAVANIQNASSGYTQSGILDVVYLDPTNGNDLNSGANYSYAVKTVTKAVELIKENGTIYILSALTIKDFVYDASQNTYTLDFGNKNINVVRDFTIYDKEFFFINLSNFSTTAEIIIRNAYLNGKDIKNSCSCIYVNKAFISSKVTIENCTFYNNNVSSYGAAITIMNGVADLVNCNFDLNKSTSTGVVVLRELATKLTISSCNFTNNTSYVHGGVIHALSGTLVVDDCYFYKNTSYGSGGTIYAIAEIKVTNSEFIQNKANNSGKGGTVFFYNGGFGSFINCKFDSNQSVGRGGAICIENSTIAKTYTIENCSFSNNSIVSDSGGAISCSANQYHTIKITNSEFKNNKSPTFGGVFFGSNCLLSVENSNFIENSTHGNNQISGGAILFGSGQLKLTNCYFLKNSSKTGGAVSYNDGSGSGVTAENCIFEENSAAGGNGGALYLLKNSTISNCIFNSNIASGSSVGYGGAIYIETAMIEDCIFKLNSARVGGALYKDNNEAKATMDSCVFYKNSAAVNGGAVVALYLIARNCEFNYNSAGTGGAGAVWSSYRSEFYNCNFMYNTSEGSAGAILAYSVNLFQDCKIMYNLAANNGGGIYSYTNVQTKLINVVITNNSAGAGGGIYFKSEKANDFDNVWYKDAIIIKNNKSGALDSSGSIATKAEDMALDSEGNIIGGKNSNFFIRSDFSKWEYNAEGYDFAQLSFENSKIGLSIDGELLEYLDENEYPIIKNIKNSNALEKITIDNDTLEIDSEERKIALYLFDKNGDGNFEIYVKFIDKEGINYTSSDYIGHFDGKDHTIDIKIFDTEENLSKYTITYGLTEGTYDLIEAPTFVNATYEGDTLTPIKVYYKISNGSSEITGFNYVVIKKLETIFLDLYQGIVSGSNDFILPWVNFVANGDTYSGGSPTDVLPYLKDVKIVDLNGNNVAGKVYIKGKSQITFSSAGEKTSKTFIFVPTNSNYSSASLYMGIITSFEYDNIYYFDNNFYPQDPNVSKENPVSKDSIDIATIATYIKDGGTLYFLSTYTLKSGKPVASATITKNITFMSLNNIETIVIENTAKLELTVGFNGSLKLLKSPDNRKSTFVNNGTLILKGNNKNIIFDGGYRISDLVGVITNTKTIEVSECIFNDLYGNAAGVFYTTAGDITITNCEFTKNRSMTGSVICGVNSKINIYDSNFYNNHVISYVNYDGRLVYGNIYLSGASSTLNIKNCSFLTAFTSVGAMQPKSYGGALALLNGVTAKIDSCVFQNCRATYGGVLYLNGIENQNNLEVVNCSFIENLNYLDVTNNSYGSGGVLNAEGLNNISFYDCLLYSNKTKTSDGFVENKSYGGVFYIAGQTNLNLDSCSIYGNSSNFGGSVIYAIDSCKVEINNCSIYRNTVYNSTSVNGYVGGAIYIGNEATLTLKNSNISKNSDYITASVYAQDIVIGDSSVNTTLTTRLTIANSVVDIIDVADNCAKVEISGDTQIMNYINIQNPTEYYSNTGLITSNSIVEVVGIISEDLFINIKCVSDWFVGSEDLMYPYFKPLRISADTLKSLDQAEKLLKKNIFFVSDGYHLVVEDFSSEYFYFGIDDSDIVSIGVYLSNTGVDTNSGLSVDSPVATLTKAVELAKQHGLNIIVLNTITLPSGTYDGNNTLIIKDASFTSNVDMFILPEGNDATISNFNFDGANIPAASGSYGCIYIYKNSECTITDCNFYNFDFNYSENTSSNIKGVIRTFDSKSLTVSNCSFKNIKGAGIYLYRIIEKSTISNIKFFNCEVETFALINGSSQHDIDINNIDIKDCYSYNNIIRLQLVYKNDKTFKINNINIENTIAKNYFINLFVYDDAYILKTVLSDISIKNSVILENYSAIRVNAIVFGSSVEISNIEFINCKAYHIFTFSCTSITLNNIIFDSCLTSDYAIEIRKAVNTSNDKTQSEFNISNIKYNKGDYSGLIAFEYLDNQKVTIANFYTYDCTINRGIRAYNCLNCDFDFTLKDFSICNVERFAIIFSYSDDTGTQTNKGPTVVIENGYFEASITSCDPCINMSKITTATIRNVEIVGFKSTTGGSSTQTNGGGIYCEANTVTTFGTPTLTIENCRIHDCLASSTDGLGGGIYIQDYRNVTIDSCYIYNNSAYNGGGIYAYWSTSGPKTAEILNSYIYNNTAENTSGGIYLYSDNGGPVAYIENCYIDGNKAEKYATIYTVSTLVKLLNSTINNNIGNKIMLYISSGSTVRNCIFSNNTVNGSGNMFQFPSVKMSDVKFINNKSNATDSGIMFHFSANSIVENTEFNNNTLKASQGTLIYLLLAKNQNSVFKNNIITHNQSGRYICNLSSTEDASAISTVLIDNCIFINNTCVEFCGNSSYVTLELKNSVISSNTFTTHGFMYSSADTNRMRYWIFENNDFYGNIQSNENYGIFSVTERDNVIIKNCNFYNNVKTFTSANKEFVLVYKTGGELYIEGGYFAHNINDVSGNNSIYVTGSGITNIKNATFQGNTEDSGENIGVVHVNANASLTMENCFFNRNSLESGNMIVNFGSLTLKDCSASENIGISGVLLKNKGYAKLIDCDIYSNESTQGGVIWNDVGGNLNIESGVYSNNKAVYGGVIYNELGGTLAISGGEFTNNEAITNEDGAVGNGGVIYNLGSAIINDGLFKSNHAVNGGVLYNLGTTTINNGEFTQNMVSVDYGAGGVICNKYDRIGEIDYHGNLVINYAYIHHNQSDTIAFYGAGIATYAGASLTINDILFENNGLINRDNTNNISCKGGAIYVADNAVLNMYGGKFNMYNFALHGGMINLNIGSKANIKEVSFILLNHRVKPNTSNGYIFIDGSELSMFNCEIKGNATGDASEQFISGNGYVILDSCKISQLRKATFFISLDNQNGKSTLILRYCSFNNISNGFYEFINFDASGNDDNSEMQVIGCDFSDITINSSSSSTNLFIDILAKFEIIDCNFYNINVVDSVKTTTLIRSMNGYREVDSYIKNTRFSNIIGEKTEIFMFFRSYNRNYNYINECTFVNNKVNRILYCLSNNSNGNDGRAYLNFIGANEFLNNEVNDLVFNNINEQITKTFNVLVGNNSKFNVSNNRNSQNQHVSLIFAVDNDMSFISGSLLEGSSIDVKFVTVDGSTLPDSSVAFKGYDGYKITSNDLAKFVLDESQATQFELKLDTTNNQILLVRKQGTSYVSVSDKSYVFNGEYHGFEKSDFRVAINGVTQQAETYKVLFASKVGGVYTETCPTHAIIGTHEIFYKVVNNITGNLLFEGSEGSVKLTITKSYLVLKQQPVAILSDGNTLASAKFYDSVVIDNMGHPVAGTWVFDNAEAVPTDTTTVYKATFTASSQETYVNTISCTIPVSFGYNELTYTQENGFTHYNKNIGLTKLSDAVSRMAKNGKIIFKETYKFTSDEIVQTNSDIVIEVGVTIALTVFEVSETVNVEFGGGTGSIRFAVHYTNTASHVNKNRTLFENKGKLVFNSNVELSAIYMKTVGSLINNDGEFIINGSKFYNNSYYLDKAGNCSIILNGSNGYIEINHGIFERNYMFCTASDVESYYSFIYNNGGNIAINGGSFIKNISSTQVETCGGLIYNTNNGNVTISGGDFIDNYSGTYGGVIFNYSGNVVINGGYFRDNKDSTGANIIYNSPEFSENKVIYNVSEEKLLAVNNNTFVEVYTEKPSIIVWICISCVILAFISYVFILKMKILNKSKVFIGKK